MKRLTERCDYMGKNHIAIASENSNLICSNFCTNCGKADCDRIRQALFKLAEYEDLEEQGHLIRIPCKIGDTIYVIPSKVNYKLNIVNRHAERNHVYKQVVNCVSPSRRGYIIYTCDNQSSELEEMYQETWFLTEEEAETALKKLGEEARKEMMV